MTDEYHPVNTFQTKPSPKVHINLPKLHIQPFDGNPLEWLTFWDCYSNAVHNNIIMNWTIWAIWKDCWPATLRARFQGYQWRHKTRKKPLKCWKNASEENKFWLMCIWNRFQKLVRLSWCAATAKSPIVLGLNWNTKTDTQSLSSAKLIKETNSTENVSKRSVLNLSSKLYFPLGFVKPVTVEAKIMIQELWKHNLTWDKELPDSFKEN